MLSGSRALEFLGCQGISALGNLVLSCRDSLLLDVKSTVPAEKVARLRYAALPSSAGLFPLLPCSPLLWMIRVVPNDALFQKTLHPPKIPQKSSAGLVRAGSTSASSANLGGASPVVARSQKQAQTATSSSSTQKGGKRKGHKGTVPFSSASGGSGRSGRKRGGAGKKSS